MAYPRPKTTPPARSSVVEKIVRAARPDTDGCLISPITSSRERPYIVLNGVLTSAVRVLVATRLDRPLQADEDVHHVCGKPRCVRPSCLMHMGLGEHVQLHIRLRREAGCLRHNRPWAGEKPRATGGVYFRCLLCDRERTTKSRARRGKRTFTAEQMARKAEWARDNRARKRLERTRE